MLTRLKVNGFKNLANVDVSFGPFTCIAGANGVGKSNLFDAILFLAALADKPLMDAARSVRDEKNRSTDIKSLFFGLGEERSNEMSFEAEMIVPPEGQDELGQSAKATNTFLRYTLVLGYRTEGDTRPAEWLEVKREELSYINVGEAHKHLPFSPHTKWRKSVVQGARRGPAFISTEDQGETRVIKLHQDGASGRPRLILAAKLPRTVLSSTNSLESPTALVAKREMQSWRLLQLEPSALRNPDPFNAPTSVGADGSHLAATLHHLAQTATGNGSSATNETAVYARVANRLSELVEDVHSVRVDEDRQRELLTLQVIDRNRTLHAARALSDGTLRFLALTILELDPLAGGLLCFEEPENGINPERISAMLRLLKDLAVDTDEEVGADNPLRQVIVNTHSPSVVGEVDDNDLLIGSLQGSVLGQRRCRTLGFSWLSGTWRCDSLPDVHTLSRGKLGVYLNPLGLGKKDTAEPKSRRVKDRVDLQPLLPGFDAE
jgi:predicted ATPase